MIAENESPLHASCVAIDGRGVLITGPSGAGKSSLALMLMALGAELVADDRVSLSMQGGAVIAQASDALSGLIEARGVGLMRVGARPSAKIVLIAELGPPRGERLPRRSTRRLLNGAAPLISVRPDAAGASIVFALLRGAELLDVDAEE